MSSLQRPRKGRDNTTLQGNIRSNRIAHLKSQNTWRGQVFRTKAPNGDIVLPSEPKIDTRETNLEAAKSRDCTSYTRTDM